MQHEHPIHIFINKRQYEIHDPVTDGRKLKQLAGIPLNDVLFLQRPGEDEVIPNDKKITLKNGDHSNTSVKPATETIRIASAVFPHQSSAPAGRAAHDRRQL